MTAFETQPERPEPIVLHFDGEQVIAEAFPSLTVLTPALLGVAGQRVTTHILFCADNGSAEYVVTGADTDGCLIARRIER